MLGQGILRLGDNIAGFIKNDGARRGGALVYRQYIAIHSCTSFRAYSFSDFPGIVNGILGHFFDFEKIIVILNENLGCFLYVLNYLV